MKIIHFEASLLLKIINKIIHKSGTNKVAIDNATSTQVLSISCDFGCNQMDFVLRKQITTKSMEN